MEFLTIRDNGILVFAIWWFARLKGTQTSHFSSFLECMDRAPFRGKSFWSFSIFLIFRKSIFLINFGVENYQ
ncbi:hypothetical protein L596_025420 [Steinernema carpocapsae]|uniref:Uncharacterized protein n=1 Tax=Steinernema carpocapsae TaxID=34508 RepID=A0A4U5M7Q0_STECR|nr:hypothetical protein L596_025420 [Steinernema carpocapsae]